MTFCRDCSRGEVFVTVIEMCVSFNSAFRVHHTEHGTFYMASDRQQDMVK